MLKFISRNAFLLRIILAPFLPSRKYVRPISKYKAHIFKICLTYFFSAHNGAENPCTCGFRENVKIALFLSVLKFYFNAAFFVEIHNVKYYYM